MGVKLRFKDILANIKVNAPAGAAIIIARNNTKTVRSIMEVYKTR